MATTAAYLIAYRNELLAGGMSPDVVDALVRDAAHLDVQSRGLRIAHPRDADTAPQGDETAPR